MKLFLSGKVQKNLRCKAEKVPVPEDLLDRWYANLIELHGADTLVAILPDFRFCVILWNVPVDPYTDLTKLLVPAIRKALRDPHYGIPLSLIDQYMPEDTVFELCTSGDRSFTSRMGAATNLVLNDPMSWFASLNGFDPLQTQRTVNRGFLERPGKETCARWEAVKEQLQLQYGRTVSALELEISLDLQQYVMRRTLVVPEDIAFGTLHLYLEKTCFHESNNLPQLFLQRLGNPEEPLHVFRSPTGESWDDDLSLAARIQEGTRFRYLYAPDGAEHLWEIDLQAKRRFTTEEDLPICTSCEGQAPPDWVDGASGYREFCKVLEDPDDPDDPRWQEYAQRVGYAWLFPDRAEDITRRLHLMGVLP